MNWFALLTKSNFEKKVYTHIQKKQIMAFLPMMKKPSIRKDRKLILETPLFRGYVFVKSNLAPEFQLRILKTAGAVKLLGTQSQPIAVPDEQIKSLKILTSTTKDLITGQNIKLKKGDPVIILNGPMTGIRGEFIRHKNKTHVIVKIDILGKYAGVEILQDCIEKDIKFL